MPTAVFKDQVDAIDADAMMVDDDPGAGNMHFIQTTFEGAFSLTFTYGGSEGSGLDGKLDAHFTHGGFSYLTMLFHI